MIIKLRNTDVDLKFTFNSFKYLQEFDVSELAMLDVKPFKMLSIASELLLGAVNSNPKVVFTESDVNEYLEESMKNLGLIELTESLIHLLEESDFFKELQKKNSPQVK